MTAASNYSPMSLDLLAPRRSGWRSRVDWRQNQDPSALRGHRKRIVICADGTWNTPTAHDQGGPAPTNVWLLFQLVVPRARDGLQQLGFYHPGVGTGGALDRVLGGICGLGLGRNILDCYRFLVDYYDPGYAIYLFGFSRGAYTVRSLAGLIRNCGIIDRDRFPEATLGHVIDAAYVLYRKRGDATAPAASRAVDFRARHSHPDCRIACIGVWDTVGALGIPVGWLGRVSQHVFGFHDVTLSSSVDCAFHAVAVDERRRPFTPTLWEQQPGARQQGQYVEQAWFAGVHADVGGGYAWQTRELANTTLRWMVNRVVGRCRLELDTTGLSQAPAAGVTLHDSYQWFYWLAGPPRVRDIDGGLGRYGTRDPFRLTAERVDDSVHALRQEYAAQPLPVAGQSYTPVNVADYLQRVEASSQIARRDSYPSDLRRRTRDGS